MDLRPLQDADLPALAALIGGLHPEEGVTVSSLESRRDSLIALGAFQHWTLAWTDGALTDGALTDGAPSGGALLGAVEAAADHNHLGSGLYLLRVWAGNGEAGDGALWEQLHDAGLEALRPQRPAGLRTRVREDWPELERYRARGFRELERLWHSTLELSTFGAVAFADRAERARAAGVRLLTLGEVGWDGAWDHPEGSTLHRYYLLLISLLAAVPFAEPITPWPYARWREVMRERGLTPDGPLVAVTPDGSWAGLCALYEAGSAPGTVLQGLTGVVRGWRGRGLAWALKLEATGRARAAGWARIETTNHAVNREMLGINAALGFVRGPAQLTLGRDWTD